MSFSDANITIPLPIDWLIPLIGHNRYLFWKRRRPVDMGDHPRGNRGEIEPFQAPRGKEHVRIGTVPFLFGCPEFTVAIDRLISGLPYELSYQEAPSEVKLIDALLKESIEFAVLTQAPAESTVDSAKLTNASLSVFLPSSHPLSKDDTCDLTSLVYTVFCLPCIENFPLLSGSLSKAIDAQLNGAILGDYHTNIQEMAFNIEAGACCPSLIPSITIREKFTANLIVRDVAPIPLFVVWRKGNSLTQLQKAVVDAASEQ